MRAVVLKKRVIACLLLNDGVLFRTKKFVPDYRYTANFVGTEAVDEVFIIDVTKGGPSPKFHEAARAYADKCFVPVTMGGWVQSLDGCKRLFDIGADKIVVGRSCLFLAGEMAGKYGSQAVVAAIDEGIYPDGELWLHASVCARLGAGEIFLQSVERDGSLGGYDIPLLTSVLDATGWKIPVVIGGGCGNWQHMYAAFAAGADGCATSNIFHMSEVSMAAFKKYLDGEGVPVRP